MSSMPNNTEVNKPNGLEHETPIYSEEAMIRTCPAVYTPLLARTDRRRTHCSITTVGERPLFRKFMDKEKQAIYARIPDAVLPYICMPLYSGDTHVDFAYIPSDPTTIVSFSPFDTGLSPREQALMHALSEFELACQDEEQGVYFLHGDFAAHNVFFDESAGLQVYDLEKTQMVDLKSGRFKNSADFISRLWFAPKFQLQAIQHICSQIEDPALQDVFVHTLREAVGKKQARTVDYYDNTTDVATHFLDARTHSLTHMYVLLGSDVTALMSQDSFSLETYVA